MRTDEGECRLAELLYKADEVGGVIGLSLEEQEEFDILYNQE